MLLDGKITAEDYHPMKQNLDKDIALLNGRLDELQQAMTPFTVPVQILLNANKVLGRSEKKKKVENDLLTCLRSPFRT